MKINTKRKAHQAVSKMSVNDWKRRQAVLKRELRALQVARAVDPKSLHETFTI